MSDEKESGEMEIFAYDPSENEDKEAKEEKKGEESKVSYARAALAIEAFGGKLFSASNEDEKEVHNIHFVDSAKLNMPNGTKKKFEAPHHRLQRLKREITDFTKQLDSFAGGDAISNMSETSANIENMEIDFGAILNDTRISPFLINDAPFPKGNLNRPDSEVTSALLAQLSSFSGKSADGVCYELFHRNKAGDKELRLNEVDRRLAAIEKRVGKLGKKPEFESIHSALGGLYAKLDILQGGNIEALTRKIAGLNAEMKLQAHVPRFQGAKGGEKLINELYDIMQKVNKSSEELPKVIEGLVGKSENHTAQVDAILRLQKLQRTQQGLKSLLNDDNKALDEANESLTHNVTVLKNNLDNFTARFAALEKNLKELQA